jgi:hypothetical protein
MEKTEKEIRGKSENRFRRDSRVLYRKVSVYITEMYGRDTEGMKYGEEETEIFPGK